MRKALHRFNLEHVDLVSLDSVEVIIHGEQNLEV